MRDEGTLRVSLEDATVEVALGGRATLRLHVENRTAVLVRARVAVTGRAAAWLHPAGGDDALELPAEGTGSLVLEVRPHRATTVEGLVPFSVHVTAGDGRRSSTSGIVVVVPERAVVVSVAPASATARRTARYVVGLRSGGDACVVALRAEPVATRVRAVLGAPTVALPAHGTAEVALTLRAARPALLTPIRHDVVVHWEVVPGGDARGTVRTVLRQAPPLPGPVTVVVGLLVLVAVVVGGRVLLGRDPLPLDLLGGARAAPSVSADVEGTVQRPYVQLGAIPQGPDAAASLERAAALADAL